MPSSLKTSQPVSLIRTVGFWGLVAMCINAVVGSGVFLLPHESFTLLGPFSLWAPLLFAVPVFILVLCFAEAARHFEAPGGAYLYARAAFGEFVGFQTGWMNWLARVTSLASLSNAFVVSLGLLLPAFKSGAPRAAVIIVTILILAAIHFTGIRYGAASIYIFTAGKLLPLIGFAIVALFAWRTNPIPGSLALPASDTHWIEAALFMLFAYAGFENLGVPAGEFKNPRRDLPLALLVGTLAIAVLYVLVQLGAMSALDDLSHTETPIASAAAAIMGGPGAIIITVGALLSLAGTNSGTMFEGSRMLYALALDRRMGALSYIHPRFRTPAVAIAVHAGFALMLALGGSFRQLALLSAVARLATYLVTCLAVPRLRRMNKAKTSSVFGRVVPVLGALISLAFVVSLDTHRVLAALIALTIGTIIYKFSQAKASTQQTSPVTREVPCNEPV